MTHKGNKIPEAVCREMHTADGSIRLREAEDGKDSNRTIEGYAIRFDTPSLPLYDDGEEEIREIIDRSAVTRELLDASDIKFTLFHDSHLLLARSKQGKGTLRYELREDGVFFSFEAPATADGDKAVELVRSGVIDGCSFAFSTRYRDREFVRQETRKEGGKKKTVCHVRKITGIYDMTLTPDPAYPATSVSNRDLAAILQESAGNDPDMEGNRKRQLDEMRKAAGDTL